MHGRFSADGVDEPELLMLGLDKDAFTVVTTQQPENFGRLSHTLPTPLFCSQSDAAWPRDEALSLPSANSSGS